MKPPPRMLRMQDVPDYVMERHGISVTRRTVYNWIKAGRGTGTAAADSLQFKRVKNPNPLHKDPQVNVTTDRWVDEFLARTARTT